MKKNHALAQIWRPLAAIFLIATLGWLGLVQPAGAQPLQPVPELTARVIDTTGTLDAAQKAAIEAKLAALEQEKGSQLVVLMVNTTAPEDIAAYANRVGNAWKIGRRDVGDGVILLVALKDRRVRIEVAKTLEGAIPDLMAKRVIDDALTPRFRQGDFAGGIEAAVDQLSALVRGEALPPVTSAGTTGGRPGAAGGAFSLAEMAIFLFIAVPVVAGIARSIFGRKLGALLTGAGVGGLAWVVTASLLIALGAGVFALVLALFSGLMASVPRSGGRGGWGPVILPPSSGGWGGGGGWSGGGGGGFSSGGGGDFGGGGASGSW